MITIFDDSDDSALILAEVIVGCLAGVSGTRDAVQSRIEEVCVFAGAVGHAVSSFSLVDVPMASLAFVYNSLVYTEDEARLAVERKGFLAASSLH